MQGWLLCAVDVMPPTLSTPVANTLANTRWCIQQTVPGGVCATVLQAVSSEPPGYDHPSEVQFGYRRERTREDGVGAEMVGSCGKRPLEATRARGSADTARQNEDRDHRARCKRGKMH